MASEEKGTARERRVVNNLIFTWLAYGLFKEWGRGPKAEEPEPDFYSPPLSPQAKDALDTAFRLGKHVESLWNMYLVASVAVVGWTVSAGENWQGYKKAAVFVLYVMFVVVNGWNLFRMYRWLNAAVADVRAEAKRYSGGASELWRAMGRVGALGRWRLEGGIYLLVFFMVVYSILSR